MQRTPVAVSVLTMDQLDERAVKDLRDLGRFTPNVYMSNTEGQNPDAISMFIRGVGLSDHFVTSDPGVGLHIDGVYYPRAQGAVLDFIDVERVEVMRGPQGTLFGKNTAGGAINVISRPPDPEGSGSIAATFGNVGQLELRGSGSIPLADSLTLGLAGLWKQRDCLTRRMYDDACVGSIDRTSARGYLRWKPASDLTIDVLGDVSINRSNMMPNHPKGYDPDQAFFRTYNDLVAAGEIPGGIPYTLTTPGVNPGRYTTSGRAPVEDPLDAHGVSLNIVYRMDNANLHSITAYRDLSVSTFENGGGGTGAVYDPASVYSQTNSHWFSQELRIDGEAVGDRLDYVGGLYYFRENGLTNDALPFFVPLQAGWVNFNSQESESYAAFAHGSFEIIDRLRLTAGIRYTRESKDWSAKYARFSSFASASFDPNTRTLELVRGNGDGIPNGLNDDPSSTARLRRSDTWTPVTPRVGIDFQATPDLLLFANVARGSRSGGFNGRATSSVAVDPFDPEYTLSYEIGEKAQFLDERIRLNATLFYTDYTDLQQTVTACARDQDGECQIDEGGLVFEPVVTNAASARIYGGELEFVALGRQRLRIEAAVGYTNARFTRVDPAATLATGLTTDSVVPFVPTWTGALAAEYVLDLARGSLTPRIDYNYVSEVAFNTNPGRYGSQDGVGLLNATLNYADPSGRWSARFFVRNLTDKVYALWINEFSHVVGGPGGAVTASDPREYGLTLAISF